ncbi:MAG: hypothetical protein U9N30_03470 [Campylobacterota bacterium]|nr:hypothetical protein [Campylobacterota bacterium]
MTNITFIILPLFAIFWMWCIVSVTSNKFKNKDDKVFWTIGLIFVPLLAFFYIFIKKDLFEESSKKLT